MDDIEEIIIREFYENEKTAMGKSVIKQLAELLGVDINEWRWSEST